MAEGGERPQIIERRDEFRTQTNYFGFTGCKFASLLPALLPFTAFEAGAAAFEVSGSGAGAASVGFVSADPDRYVGDSRSLYLRMFLTRIVEDFSMLLLVTQAARNRLTMLSMARSAS
ncbi:MAG: hypothetical protein KIT09_00060 [Bryobacteraceae bacterium]|nr:hypothetical protein [Bryobacteraceae bacterium]